MKTRCIDPDLSPILEIPRFQHRSEIPYDATCTTLHFNSELSCNACVGETDKLRKKSSNKRIKF